MRKTQEEKKEDPMDAFFSMTDKLGFSPMGDTKYGMVQDLLPTFIPPLDKLLGGGIPFGKITEIYAPKYAGKSTFVSYLTSVANHLGVNVLYIDSEASDNQARMLELGVDINKTRTLVPTIKNPMNVEMVGKTLDEILDAYGENKDLNKHPFVVIWDSLAATVAKAQQDIDLGDQGALGRHAASITTMLNKIAPKINVSNMSLIIVNQVRANLKATNPYSDKYVRPGAQALDHWEWLLVFLQKSNKFGYTSSDTEYRGHLVRFSTKKNKSLTANRKDYASLLSGYKIDTGKKDAIGQPILIDLEGFNPEYNIFYLADSMGMIKTARSWKEYITDDGEEIKLTKNDFLLRMLQEPDHKLAKELFRKVLIATFPEKVPFMNNETIDYRKWPLWSKDIDDYYDSVAKKLSQGTVVAHKE